MQKNKTKMPTKTTLIKQKKIICIGVDRILDNNHTYTGCEAGLDTARYSSRETIKKKITHH